MVICSIRFASCWFLEEAGGADEDGVELSSDEEEGTVVDDAGSLVSAVVLSVEDSAVDSL